MSKTGLEARDAAAASVAVAPRVTLEQIQSLVASERYFVDDTLTICVLTLKNGFKVTGESAAADPANFNEELGRKIAREKAVAEIWPLAGFLLRDTLHRGERAAVMRCKVVLTAKTPNISFDHYSKAGGQVDNPYRPGEQMADMNDPRNWKADGVNVHFAGVYGGTAADGKNATVENRIFGDATPSFSLSATIRNQHVLHALEQGVEYYVDFTPAPKG